MIPVTLRNIFFNHERGEAWWVLADATGQHGLPIFVGSGDPRLIAFGFRKNNPRPLTFNFFADILEVVGAELTEVQVAGLEANTFRAVACIRAAGVEHQVDARPSDAVALAGCMNRPIYLRKRGSDGRRRETARSRRKPPRSAPRLRELAAHLV